MSLDPKTIYVAQRTDDGSAWREVYLSGSNLLIQTDSSGYLTGSSVLPPSITILSASYANTSETSISASYSYSASFSRLATSASYAFSASFSDTSISASYSDYSLSASFARSSSYAISSSKAFLANFSISAVSSSYALSASYAASSSYTTNASTASFINYTNVRTVGSNWISASAQFTPVDVFNVGTITASAIQVTNLSVINISSSTVYSSGSNVFGNVLTNTQTFTGSVDITGSLTVNGPVNIGLMLGTASYAINSATASYLIGGITIDTGSLVVTASGALTNETASYAMTASYINNVGTGSGYLVGTPIDGYYGPGVTGSITNIQQGDRVEDALDKVENILFKLAPARPPNLSSKSLLLVGAYSANIQGTNTTVTSAVTNNTTPTIQLVGGMTSSNSFGDGDTGTLSAIGQGVGTKVLSTSDDSGTYGDLQITQDQDYYLGQIGKAGFWKSLLAQVVITTPISTVGPHTQRLQHTLTGNTPTFNFYIDNPVTPTNVTGSVVATGSIYISGVPALVGGLSGSSVTLSATASNSVGRFYNSTRIFQGSGTGVSTSTFTLPSSPVSGSIVSGSRVISINGGSVSENASFTLTAFNSIGATSTFTLSNTNIRLDSTLDGVTRIRSGQGQYPNFGFSDSTFGRAFESSASCAESGNEELQMLNGQYQYPTGNYTGSLPIAGPDYSSVPVGTYSNFRWVTFNAGTAVSNTNVTVNFSNATGFSGALMSNFKLYVQIGPGGSPGTNGWVDGNSAFPGTGNPNNNGDPALVVAGSTSTSKLITFGTSVKSGNVFVRVGIPVGDSKKFGSLSVTVS